MKASNISATALAQWRPGYLNILYDEDDFGPLSAPLIWPQYGLNAQMRAKTDDKVQRSGIYLPDLGNSCAQLLIEGHDAWGAPVMRHPDDPSSQAFDRVPTTWTLIERIADEGRGVPGEEPWRSNATQRLRCVAGQPCPHEGWWFTPASPASRRQFVTGEMMPIVNPTYGINIWQWDSHQEA